MIDRPTKMHNGIKVIGVVTKDGNCFVKAQGETFRCPDRDNEYCRCPINGRGLWLPEPEALALLLTGDVE